MSKHRKKILPYILALIFIAIIGYSLRNENVWSLMKTIRPENVILTIIVTCCFFLANGLQFSYNVLINGELKLPFKEYFNVPVLMNLFSYLLPLNGGMIFASVYLKGKYKMSYAGGLASGGIVLLFSLFITGTSGIFYGLFSHQLPDKMLFLFVLFLLPVFFWPVFLYIKKRPSGNIFWRVLNLIIATAEQLKLSLKAPRVWFYNIAFTLLSILMNALWFYTGVLALGFHINIFQTFIFALLLRIAMLMKFIPGNLGFQELILGLIISMTGYTIKDGMLISLYLRACTLSISLFYGIPLFLQNKKYLTRLRLLE